MLVCECAAELCSCSCSLEAGLLMCQVSELEPPMDEGDGVALMDADFPEDTLPEKHASVVQVSGTGRREL